ncbi:MAG: Ig-like domain-containing protein [Oscillospiraceae bacterium]|nr:Ig-like domain-containing protein [Oscillospiraceae bacterium]
MKKIISYVIATTMVASIVSPISAIESNKYSEQEQKSYSTSQKISTNQPQIKVEGLGNRLALTIDFDFKNKKFIAKSSGGTVHSGFSDKTPYFSLYQYDKNNNLINEYHLNPKGNANQIAEQLNAATFSEYDYIKIKHLEQDHRLEFDGALYNTLEDFSNGFRYKNLNNSLFIFKNNVVSIIEEPELILPTNINFDKIPSAIDVNQIFQATTIYDKNVTFNELVFESKDNSIVSIDSFGNIKGEKSGTTTIKASFKDYPEIFIEHDITVNTNQKDSIHNNGIYLSNENKSFSDDNYLNVVIEENNFLTTIEYIVSKYFKDSRINKLYDTSLELNGDTVGIPKNSDLYIDVRDITMNIAKLDVLHVKNNGTYELKSLDIVDGYAKINVNELGKFILLERDFYTLSNTINSYDSEAYLNSLEDNMFNPEKNGLYHNFSSFSSIDAYSKNIISTMMDEKFSKYNVLGIHSLDYLLNGSVDNIENINNNLELYLKNKSTKNKNIKILSWDYSNNFKLEEIEITSSNYIKLSPETLGRFIIIEEK